MTLINTPITLFKAQELFPVFAAINHPNNHSGGYTSRPIKVVPVNGNHLSLLDSQYAEALALAIG